MSSGPLSSSRSMTIFDRLRVNFHAVVFLFLDGEAAPADGSSTLTLTCTVMSMSSFGVVDGTVTSGCWMSPAWLLSPDDAATPGWFAGACSAFDAVFMMVGSAGSATQWKGLQWMASPL